TQHLFELEFRHLLGAGPDDRLTAFMSEHHQLKRLLLVIAQRLLQHAYDELHRMMIVIFQNDVVRRQATRLDFFLFQRLGGHADVLHGAGLQWFHCTPHAPREEFISRSEMSTFSAATARPPMSETRACWCCDEYPC